jgi:HAD superfamily hydrolase (TIGR01509 family)
MISKSALSTVIESKKLLIFDFDGTIADTSPFHEQAFIEVFAPLNIKVNYSDISGQKTLDAIHHLCKGENFTDKKLNELVLKKQKKFKDIIDSNLKPLPGVEQFLEWAFPHYDLALASSGSSSNILFCLKQLNYYRFFKNIICGDDVENGKPNPEIFLTVIRNYNYRLSDVLVFEDSKAGFDAAKAAGIDFFDANYNIWKSLNK